MYLTDNGKHIAQEGDSFLMENDPLTILRKKGCTLSVRQLLDPQCRAPVIAYDDAFPLQFLEFKVCFLFFRIINFSLCIKQIRENILSIKETRSYWKTTH